MEEWKYVIAVTNRKLTRYPYLEQIERICYQKPKAVIVREKDLTEEEYFQLSSEVSKICEKHGILCIYHTFLQVAGKAEARAIHLPLSLLKDWNGKKPLEKFEIIGASIHSVTEAREAQKLGASYITAGHIYQTGCKRGVAPRGVDFLKEICRAVSIPVYAIGGIHVAGGQLEEVMNAGAAGGCVMSEAMRV